MKGYRTYTSIALAVIVTGMMYVFPEYSQYLEVVQKIATASGFWFLRAAIK